MMRKPTEQLFCHAVLSCDNPAVPSVRGERTQVKLQFCVQQPRTCSCQRPARQCQMEPAAGDLVPAMMRKPTEQLFCHAVLSCNNPAVPSVRGERTQVKLQFCVQQPRTCSCQLPARQCQMEPAAGNLVPAMMRKPTKQLFCHATILLFLPCTAAKECNLRLS